MAAVGKIIVDARNIPAVKKHMELYARVFRAARSAQSMCEIAAVELSQRANAIADEYVAMQLRLLSKELAQQATELRLALVVTPEES